MLNMGMRSNKLKKQLMKAHPVMLATSQDGFVVRATSYSRSYYPYRAFGSGTWVRWNEARNYIELQFPTPTVINGFIFKSAGGNIPKNFTVIASNDRANFSTPFVNATNANPPASSWSQFWKFSNSTPYLYWRMNVTATTSTHCYIDEIEFHSYQ